MSAVLESERLILRPLALSDATTIRELAGDYEVAKTTLVIPHPYPEGAAETYIQSLIDDPEQHVFAIVRRSDQQLMGSIGIHPEPRFKRAMLGYWIGVPYWNQGYMSEAARRLIDYGFEALVLNRIYAYYLSQNIASRRVMEKAGMVYEATFRQHVERFGNFYDVGYCGILRSDWAADD
ncbi:MAG: GNAT family N-acetyltransferase [Chloroflexota bacterium]